MTSTERVKATLANQPVDRIPISGWRHFPLVDQHPEKFIEKTIEYTDRNDWDIIKLMSQGQFFAQAYGAEIQFSTDPLEWGGKVIRYVVEAPADLEKLQPLPASNPILDREVKLAKGVVEHYKGSKVIIGTTFTPLSWLKQLSPGNPAIAHIQPVKETSPLPDFIQNHKEALHRALRAINQTNKNFVDAQIAAGVDGFFIAEQFASEDDLSREAYAEFGKPYLEELLAYIKGRTWFNMLHIHGSRKLIFDELAGADVQSINWEDRDPAIKDDQQKSLGEIRSITDKVLVGGIEKALPFKLAGQREQLKAHLTRRYQALQEETGGKGVVFAPGCGFGLDVDESLYSVVLEVVQGK
ncbi:uroporphyrinogen decarboxylase family protein [Oscillospiraceae bacterium MB08-C2-2]|nr:uroporphyrinogen decarboxylase family protein [Oscillospiraceae bacterium MB08-C2-2]